MFQYRILQADYHNPFGLALSHPLYIFLGGAVYRLFGVFSPFLINALSAIFAAAGIATLFLVVNEITGRRWLALVSVSMFGVSHTLWWLATITETYTFQLFLFTLELYLLTSLLKSPGWKVTLFLGFVSGTGVSVHNLALLPLPVYLAVLLYLITKKQLNTWTLAGFFLTWVAGAIPYLVLIGKDIMLSADLHGTIRSALFGNFENHVLGRNMDLRYFKANLFLIALNFVNISLPLAALGIAVSRKKLSQPQSRAILALGLIEFIFVIRYNVVDQFNFVLPTMAMITIFSALGLNALVDRSKTWRGMVMVMTAISIVAPPIIYGSLPGLATRIGINTNRDRYLPYRDELRYWIIPWKHNEKSTAKAAIEALQTAARQEF